MKKIVSILLFLLLIMSHMSYADMFHEYIEYRYQPDLGKITILSSAVRSEKYVDYVSDNWEEVAKKDIFVHGPYFDGEKRVFQRSHTIGKYKIETTLTLYPPSGSGMGGAHATTKVQVTINGKKKIDCNIGSLPGGNQEVSEIMICPEDDFIAIDASNIMTGKIICGGCVFISGETIITNKYITTSKY